MLRLAGIDVNAISIGGVETCIDLPGHKLCFDLGRAPDFATSRATVLFTHAHVDHMAGVVWHCATRKLRGMAPPKYVVGRENTEAFRELFEVWRKLDRSEMPHELVELSPGEELVLAPGRVVRAFRSPHRAPCQGYAVLSRRPKLRAEFRELPPAEIAMRRARGDELFDTVDVTEVAFPGDTRIEVVEREELVRTARLLILEATFVGDDVDVAHARETGHVHLREIAERADLFENEAILLTHFSPRYSKAEIVAALDRLLPAGLRERCTPLLTGR